ncbi:(2Fe-2S)-binding protein [Pseudomonas sp.]|uniref:(2Fe-2S)-binding protein n=1 Tax=Pseudomonas sp. TaxID=306 RepID=UPI003CC6D06F
MFRRVAPCQAQLSFSFESRPLTAHAGDSVALALLAAGIDICRTSVVGGQPRGPYCLMGACFECLVTIDGVPNRQACLVLAREGMVVNRQVASPVIHAQEA